MKIGICGTGRMGSSIAARLMSLGHEVGVWNRNQTRAEPLVKAGAKLFPTPAALIDACDTAIVILLNDTASEAVYRGPIGILKANLSGKLLIDMSTVRPDTMQTFGAAVASAGGSFVESPVGGSIGPAREGKLFALVGGQNPDVSRAMPVLEQLCRRIEYIGTLGSGATMKLAINLPLLVYWQALGESLAICRHLNLPADKLIDILSDTAGTPTAMKGRGPAIAKALAGQSPGDAAFSLSAAKKDLATAVQLATTFDAELPVAASALACFEEAEAAGLGAADATAASIRWPQRGQTKPKS